MRTLLRRGSLVLALGLFTTLVVAVACALIDPSRHAEVISEACPEDGPTPLHWYWPAPDRPPPRSIMVQAAPGYSIRILSTQGTFPPEQRYSKIPYYAQVRTCAGFPLPALERRFNTGQRITDGRRRGPFIWYSRVEGLGVLIGDGPTRRTATIPLTFNFSGLAIDTLCFGAAWLLVLYFARWRRELRRRALGMCVSCGYELGGFSACPECGPTPRAEAVTVRI